MSTLHLVEGAPPVERDLSSTAGLALAHSGVVTAHQAPGRQSWMIGTAGKVGVARLADVEVWIRPKLHIRRLMFLVGYALRPQTWERTTVAVAEASELLPPVTAAFAQQVERALGRGLLQDYRTVEEAQTILRGRIREADQLRRRYGLAVPLEVRYDEFDVDVPENQLLRAACERLLRLPLGPDVRGLLRRQLVRLADVSRLPLSGALPRWQPTRLNARYSVALGLAELVLRAGSFEQTPGEVRTSGFLLDMPRVFEDFVCAALRESLAAFGGRVQLQDPHHLDVDELVRMKPDLVWWRGGKPVAVVDAKYKAEKPAGFPDADLYQMLAYCIALQLPHGHLVYAKGNEEPRRHLVRHADVEIVCHALDLDQEPQSLLAQMRSIAAELQAAA